MMRNLIVATAALLLAIKLPAQQPYDVSTKSSASPEAASKQTERSAFMQKFQFLGPCDYYPGMRFMVAPDAEQVGLGEKGVGQRYGTADRLRGKEITLDSIQGKNLFFHSDSTAYGFMVSGDCAAARPPCITGLISLDAIDQAKAALEGKTIWCQAETWYQDGSRRYPAPKRFCPVRVERIGIGTSKEPLKIVFSYSGKEYYQTVWVTETSRCFGIFGASFDDVFSMSDPKLKYPKIPAKNWAAIQESKVLVGMTKAECELSWGKPDDINTTIVGSSRHEQWVYSGSYLYLQNGILKSIQN